MIKLFGKKQKEDKTAKPQKDLTVSETGAEKRPAVAIDSSKGAQALGVIKGVYLSEKATLLSGYNQYIFKTFINANKSEVGKAVEKLFNVKVKAVKVLNMPQKRKDVGKYPGFRTGFKKAVVVLEKGYTIEQAKP